MIQVLLRATVLERHAHFPNIQVVPPRPGEAEGAFALGKPGQRPLPLRNGAFLRLLLTFRVEPSLSANGALKLKTISSNVQYQLRADDDESWVFRYEYFRRAPNQYAPGHIHIRGTPHQQECLPGRKPLEDVHFPTGRVTLESIIRLLIDDFGIPANEDPEVWRPLLHETEQTFIKIARQPVSGL